MKDESFCPQISCKNRRKFLYERKNMKSESRRWKKFAGIIQIEVKLRSLPTHINKKNFLLFMASSRTYKKRRSKNGLTFTMLIKRMNKLQKFETSFICAALTYSY